MSLPPIAPLIVIFCNPSLISYIASFTSICYLHSLLTVVIFLSLTFLYGLGNYALAQG